MCFVPVMQERSRARILASVMG